MQHHSFAVKDFAGTYTGARFSAKTLRCCTVMSTVGGMFVLHQTQTLAQDVQLKIEIYQKF